ncbi:hypothetical protein ACFL6G_09620 [candidate division KSB1 bacterium]
MDKFEDYKDFRIGYFFQDTQTVYRLEFGIHNKEGTIVHFEHIELSHMMIEHYFKHDGNKAKDELYKLCEIIAKARIDTKMLLGKKSKDGLDYGCTYLLANCIKGEPLIETYWDENIIEYLKEK